MKKTLAVISLFALAFALQGKVLLETQFANGESLPDNWKNITHFGDFRGSIQPGLPLPDGRRPLLVITPTERSWAVLVGNFQRELPDDIRHFRLTAVVLCSTPARMRAMALVGTEVGGQPLPGKEFHAVPPEGAAPYTWAQYSVDITREPGELVSVGVGLDYGDTTNYSGWVLIGAIRCESLADGEEPAPPIDWTVPKQLRLPKELAASCFPFDTKRMLDAQTEKLARLEADGLSDTPVAKELKATRDALKNAVEGDLDPKNLADLTARCLTQSLTYSLETGIADYRLGCANREERRPDAPVLAPIGSVEHFTLLADNSFYQLTGCHVAVKGDLAPRATVSEYKWVADCPSLPVPGTPDTIYNLAPGMVSGFDLAVETAGLAPGRHSATLEITPLSTLLKPVSIPFELEVIDYTLPEKLPNTSIYAWDYGHASDPRYLKWLKQGRVNVFLCDTREPECFAKTVRGLTAAGYRPGEFTLYFETWLLREHQGWYPEFEPILAGWLDELKALGVDDEHYVFHCYDEVFSEEFKKTAQEIKKRFPRLKIFSDHLVADTAYVQSFSDLVDYWCPLEVMLLGGQFPETFEMMRNSGKPLWTYLCHCRPVEPDYLFRIQPWMAFHFGMDGFGQWTINPGSEIYGSFGLTYLMDGQLLPSRHLLSWLRGVEDYMLLTKAAETHPEEVRKLAAELYSLRGTPFKERAETARQELLTIIREEL